MRQGVRQRKSIISRQNDRFTNPALCQVGADMNAEYELTVDDFVAFALLRVDVSPALRKQRRDSLFLNLFFWCGFLFALAALIVAMNDAPALETVRQIFPWLALPLLFVIVLLVIPTVRPNAARLTRQLITEQSPDGLRIQCSLAIETDSLVESRAAGVTTRHWNSIEKMLISATHVFIYTSVIEAFVLPRRAFASPDEDRQFIEQVSQRSGVEPVNV